MEQRNGEFLIGQQVNSEHVSYGALDYRNDGLGSMHQGVTQDPPNYRNLNFRPSDLNKGVFGRSRPVLNYSIQTGEEFALEFMWERVNPREQYIPNSSVGADTEITMGDLHGMLGPSHTAASEGLSDGGKSKTKDPVTHASQFEQKPVAKLLQSVTRTSSENTGVRRFRGRSSLGSFASSRTLKLLCSFGGKVLPRPSDRKLRYVGGETRIIRIHKEISFEELKQKTLGMYPEPHSIKYQLPGEDLDALVSVSSDEDLQNMMEECNVLGNCESQKLRIFLISDYEMDDSELSIESMEGDSEIQYVVAVNGMDVGSRRSSLCVESHFGSNLDDLLGLSVERDACQISVHRQAKPVVDSPSTNNKSSQVGLSSSSQGIVVDSFVYQARDLKEPTDWLSSRAPHPLENETFSTAGEKTIVPPPVVKGEYGPHPSKQETVAENMVSDPVHGLKVPLAASNDELPGAKIPSASGSELNFEKNCSFQKKIECRNHHSQVTSVIQMDRQVNKEALTGSIIESTPQVQSSDEKIKPLYMYDMENISEEAPRDGIFADKVTSVVPTKTCEKNYDKTRNSYVFSNVMVEKMNNHNLDDHPCTSAATFTPVQADTEMHAKEMSSEPGVLPQRTFHSERIPREQSTINRSTKSDDFSVPHLLVAHSQSDVSSQHITESVDKLTDQNVSSNLEKVDDSAELTRINLPSMESKRLDSTRLKDADETGTTTSCIPEEDMSNHKVVLNTAAPPATVTPATKIFVTNQGNFEYSQEVSARKLLIHPNKMNENTREGKPLPVSREEIPPTNTSQSQPNLVVGTPEHRDILINVNDRFPREFLSDIYSKAMTVESPTDVTAPPHGDAAGAADQVDSSGPVPDIPGKSYALVRPDMTQTTGIQSPQLSRPINIKAPGYDYQGCKKAAQPAGFPLPDFSLKEFDPNTLQIIKNRDLEELRELGSGTYGTVYHGKWRGTDVAIKRIKKSCFIGRSSEQERLTAEFWHEAEILSKLHHPNVVAFYGVVQDGPGGTLATVTEFMVNGSLRHALISKDRHLDRRKRLIIAMDAAFGMEYLHSRNIVHFDLKCDNLLVNLKDPSRPICKVGDFGLSKIKRNTLVTGGVRGTLPWMAPELLNGSSSKVSEKVDVFSFGIVLWEILTGEEPYANMHYGAIIGGIVNNTLRPPVPSYCDPEWRVLMEQCWAPDPLARPSFPEIARRLRTMSSTACPSPTKHPHYTPPK
ncbi:uncharacterized protein LOC127247261 isoform X2 [Andrographis paniculata]|uniref:uncharacterized protein LOC127247261 isoform X2 n=1 Tax=Andrographis paniculata TaxID=175694 RepID=UPI0021E7701E|nr:uncharacterized protein LOC127247261 isoform X2 [Andrographis paniculata]